MVDEFELSPAELAVWEQALRSLDLADDAAAQLERDGLTTTDRYGGQKAHPLLDVVARNRTIYARLVAQLGVELEEAPSPTTEQARRAAAARWGKVTPLEGRRRGAG